MTKETARRFLLLKQGLLGGYIFAGKQGAFDYVRQAGCIQFDPIDSVGRNAELTLQSRVKGFRKKDLYDLLYKDRRLVDYFDKELAILPAGDWPYFRRYRDLCRSNGERFEGLREKEEQAFRYIEAHGPVSSSTLPVEGMIRWHSSIHWSGSWSGEKTKAARSVLEQMYTAGELVIHHKEGNRKFYDLAQRHLPADLLSAEDPLPCDDEHIRWRIRRRIGAVGMLWNRNSAAYLGIWNLDRRAAERAFDSLLESGEILPVEVEGIRHLLYILAEDAQLLQYAEEKPRGDRVEFLAPLDPMLWDRDLIEKIFGFRYSWEIYTPKEKRKYGYYVLPVLYRDRLIGRIEPVIDQERLYVKGLWLEDGVRHTKKLDQALEARLVRFAKFNDAVYQSTKLSASALAGE